MNFLKRTFPLILAFVLGWAAIISDYIPLQASQDMMSFFTKSLIIIASVTVFLGIYYLLRMHYMKIKRKQPAWGYSCLVWLGFIIMIGFGIFNEGKGPFVVQAEAGWVPWLYKYAFAPCQATMFSILAFFIASAAYRTFRAKSLEAGILLIAAVIVMFGKVPISTSVWEGFPDLAQWLLDYPNLAVKRAIYFGIGLGGVSTALRIIFGIERSYLGGE
jgi:hypothetical protein